MSVPHCLSRTLMASLGRSWSSSHILKRLRIRAPSCKCWDRLQLKADYPCSQSAALSTTQPLYWQPPGCWGKWEKLRAEHKQVLTDNGRHCPPRQGMTWFLSTAVCRIAGPSCKLSRNTSRRFIVKCRVGNMDTPLFGRGTEYCHPIPVLQPAHINAEEGTVLDS